MKKLFMLAAMMAITIAASTQFYVGGTLGLSTSKNEYETDFGANVSMSTTDYGICSKAGYNFTTANEPDNKVRSSISIPPRCNSVYKLPYKL